MGPPETRSQVLPSARRLTDREQRSRCRLSLSPLSTGSFCDPEQPGVGGSQPRVVRTRHLFRLMLLSLFPASFPALHTVRVAMTQDQRPISVSNSRQELINVTAHRKETGFYHSKETSRKRKPRASHLIFILFLSCELLKHSCPGLRQAAVCPVT